MFGFGRVVVFWQKWLNSGKSGYILQSDGFLAQCFYSSISGCIRAKIVVFGKKWLYLGKVIVFVQKWLNSGKIGYI